MPDKVKKYYFLNTTPMPIPRVYRSREFNRRNDVGEESNSDIILIGFEFKPEFDGLDPDLF